MDCCKENVREKVARKWKRKLRLDSIEELEDILDHYSHRELCRPFAIMDIRNGVDRGVVMVRYCLSAWDYRQICIEIGKYKRPVKRF